MDGTFGGYLFALIGALKPECDRSGQIIEYTYDLGGVRLNAHGNGLCLANIPTAVKYPRGGAHRARTKMVRQPTTLTTMASRRPRVNRLTPSSSQTSRAGAPIDSPGIHVGRAEPSVRRRAPAAAGSDADAVVKVILNDLRAR